MILFGNFYTNLGVLNMLFKKKLVTVAGALILASSAYATQEAVCPDINAIKAEGLTMAELVTQNVYFSYNISTFDTGNYWGFVMAPIEANSSDEAINTANEILTTMSSAGIPTKDREHNEMVCLYETGQPDLLAAAVNAEHMMSPSQLKRYVLKAR